MDIEAKRAAMERIRAKLQEYRDGAKLPEDVSRLDFSQNAKESESLTDGGVTVWWFERTDDREMSHPAQSYIFIPLLGLFAGILSETMIKNIETILKTEGGQNG